MMTLNRRPRNLDQVIGHSKIVNALKEYSKENRGYPQVLLLSGSSGLGKTSTAQIIAQTLVCENPIISRSGVKTPCGVCSQCEDIIKERFSMDVVNYDCSGMGKQDILALDEEMRRGASYGKNKVLILEESQQLSTKASMGALLRILEAVRRDTYIILLTMDIKSLPKSVTDRCSILNFKKFKPTEIAPYLMEILEELDPKEEIYPETIIDVITAIAYNSDGSMRNALQTFQRAIDSKIFTEEELIEELDITTESTLEAFITEVLKGNASALYTISKSDSLSNIFGKLLSMMITWKRNYMTNTFFNEGEQKKCEFFVANKNFNSLLDTFVDISKDNDKYFNNDVFYYHILKFIDSVKEVKVIKEEVKPTTSRRKLKEV